MVIENVAVQLNPSFETTSQKAKQTPAIRSPAKLGRRALVEGTFDAIDGDKPVRPQRG